jgi:hypothetical protein
VSRMGALSQNKRLLLGGGAVLAVIIVLIGWFAVINPQLSAASSARDQAEAARLQNIVLQGKNTKLKAQNDNAAALRASLAAALAELPSDGGLPAFTRQLSAQATAASVVLSSVIVGAATPVVGVVAATGATTGAAAPAPSPGLVQITMTLAATGLGRNDLAFLKAIQVTGPRRVLVTASQLAPSGGGAAAGIDGPCTLTLTLTIFSAPLSPPAQAALEKLLSGK